MPGVTLLQSTCWGILKVEVASLSLKEEIHGDGVG